MVPVNNIQGCQLLFSNTEAWNEEKAVPEDFDSLQTGMFVIQPSLPQYEQLTRNLGFLPSYDGSDQGYVTSFFRRNRFQTTLILDSSYNYMKLGLKRDPKFDLSRIRLLHFVGKPKPWQGADVGYDSLEALWLAMYHHKEPDALERYPEEWASRPPGRSAPDRDGGETGSGTQ